MAPCRIPWRAVPGTPELAKRFGERVRSLRTTRGLSRDQLAKAVGLGKNALARIERGERFNAANLAPLAAALGCEVRDLFDFGDERASRRLDAIVALLRSASPRDLEIAERLLRALLLK